MHANHTKDAVRLSFKPLIRADWTREAGRSPSLVLEEAGVAVAALKRPVNSRRCSKRSKQVWNDAAY